VERLLRRPSEIVMRADMARNRHIPRPRDLFAPGRRNSRGVDFGHARSLRDLLAEIAVASGPPATAAPLVDGLPLPGTEQAVVSPIDGSIAGHVVQAAPDFVDRTMAAARTGFRAWSMTPSDERAAILERAADLLEERRGRLLHLLQVEGGKTLDDALSEVREAVDFCRYYAAEGRALFQGRRMPGPTGEANVLGLRGRGVFVAISPWNFPLAIFLGQITAALMAGNAVVAKPAEQTPLIAAEAVRILHEAGVPFSALHLMTGDGRIGARLVEHPDVAGVVFTGSTEVARLINRALAAKDGPIVPLIAETGGVNAMIVDATALPEQVADDVVTSAFRSAGQRCSALRLLCVQDDVADRMIDMIAGAAAVLKIGDPRQISTHCGPVIDADAKARLEAHMARMRGEAVRVHYAGTPPLPLAGEAESRSDRVRVPSPLAGEDREGGSAEGTASIRSGATPTPSPSPQGGGERGGAGFYVAPHIFELARPEALTDEVFGPILHVVRYRADDLDRLLDAIEGTGYGLTLGIHSRIDATVEHVASRLAVGNVYVNRNMIGAVVGVQPFGGHGLSGTGPKAGGPHYLVRFATEQTVTINTAAAGGNAGLIATSE
jgi:RHH-type proline utilization regulon transcriptional repressor/proline dehydrogenase/delta 1-pyrroline-5-carboxylate dehydrogenase